MTLSKTSCALLAVSALLGHTDAVKVASDDRLVEALLSDDQTREQLDDILKSNAAGLKKKLTEEQWWTRVRERKKFASEAQEVSNSQQILKVIEKDLPRTHFFPEGDNPMSLIAFWYRSIMFAGLREFSKSKFGYLQGMNFMAALKLDSLTQEGRFMSMKRSVISNEIVKFLERVFVEKKFQQFITDPENITRNNAMFNALHEKVRPDPSVASDLSHKKVLHVIAELWEDVAQFMNGNCMTKMVFECPSNEAMGHILDKDANYPFYLTTMMYSPDFSNHLHGRMDEEDQHFDSITGFELGQIMCDEIRKNPGKFSHNDEMEKNVEEAIQKLSTMTEQDMNTYTNKIKMKKFLDGLYEQAVNDNYMNDIKVRNFLDGLYEQALNDANGNSPTEVQARNFRESKSEIGEIAKQILAETKESWWGKSVAETKETWNKSLADIQTSLKKLNVFSLFKKNS